MTTLSGPIGKCSSMIPGPLGMQLAAGSYSLKFSLRSPSLYKVCSKLFSKGVETSVCEPEVMHFVLGFTSCVMNIIQDL